MSNCLVCLLNLLQPEWLQIFCLTGRTLLLRLMQALNLSCTILYRISCFCPIQSRQSCILYNVLLTAPCCKLNVVLFNTELR